MPEPDTTEKESETYRTAMKCLHCGVHFNVYSWDKGWANLHQDARYCPECGAHPSFALGEFEEEGFIFQYVSSPSMDPETFQKLQELTQEL